MKDQLRHEWTALMQEGADGQATRFRMRAMRLAHMLRKSQPELAGALTEGLSYTTSLTRLQPPAQPQATAPDLLMFEQNPALPLEPHWPATVDLDLQRIVIEWEMRSHLHQAGLAPIQTVLLSGPPGVGKTLSARWLAQQLGMPLATLNLSNTLNSYLGKTGQNLNSALDYARGNACVLFLDEFDALAKRRSDEQDIGELKRVVNVLLQSVDQWDGPSLLVAATNHEDLLDKAMLRRFELTIRFPPASQKQVMAILKSLGVPSKMAIALSKNLKEQPLSTATRLVTAARKRQVLDKLPFEDALQAASAESGLLQAPIQRRRALAKIMTSNGASSHQIAKRLGVSHTTILRDLATFNDKDGNP